MMAPAVVAGPSLEVRLSMTVALLLCRVGEGPVWPDSERCTGRFVAVHTGKYTDSLCTSFIPMLPAWAL